MSTPRAYFISFTTYGTWLHGRDPGSVDRAHNEFGTPVLPPDKSVENRQRNQLRGPVYRLDAPRRDVVVQTIREVCDHRGWQLWAAHARTNHVHAVVTAGAPPEKVMIDLKAWATRRLRERVDGPDEDTRWTHHGSTRYLWDDRSVAAACHYVLNEQGERMAHFDGRESEPRPNPSEP